MLMMGMMMLMLMLMKQIWLDLVHLIEFNIYNVHYYNTIIVLLILLILVDMTIYQSGSSYLIYPRPESV